VTVLDKLIVRDLVASLPPRERRLAELLMAGHTGVSAAKKLRLRRSQFRTCLRHIRQKLAA